MYLITQATSCKTISVAALFTLAITNYKKKMIANHQMSNACTSPLFAILNHTLFFKCLHTNPFLNSLMKATLNVQNQNCRMARLLKSPKKDVIPLNRTRFLSTNRKSASCTSENLEQAFRTALSHCIILTQSCDRCSSSCGSELVSVCQWRVFSFCGTM